MKEGHTRQNFVINLLLGIIFSLGTGVIFFSYYSNSLAYQQHTTHPALTAEIAKFFNSKNTRPGYSFSNQETEWLKEGAIEEDEPARWINHFYDPVHHVGWSGKHYGWLTEAEGYKTGADIAPKTALPSIEWVVNQNYQAAYGRQFGNQTWQKALKAYIDGDKKTAYIALGHVLHLIEDATVPDHTRDDSHPGIEGDPGSPFESYAGLPEIFNNLQVANNLDKNNVELINLPNIQSAFESVATYSNNNFFSEDTISNEEFDKPDLGSLIRITKKISNNEVVDYLYDNKKDLILAKIQDYKNSDFVGSGNLTRLYTIDDKYFVMPSYASRLLPKAVLTGASVIKLFFNEAEKYKAHPELLEPIVPDSKISFWEAAVQAPKRTILAVCSKVGDGFCTNVYNGFGSAVASTKGFFGSLATIVASRYEAVKVTLGFASATAQSGGGTVNAGAEPTVNNQIILTPPIAESNKTKIVSVAVVPQVKSSALVTKSEVVEAAPEAVQEPPLPQEQQITQNVGTSIPSVPSSPASSQSGYNTSAQTQETSAESASGAEPPVSQQIATTTLAVTSTPQIETSVTSSPTSSDFMATSTPADAIVNTSTVATVSSTPISLATSTPATTSTTTPATTSTPPVVVVPTVVINEIAWAGTSADFPTDEWLELYNTTDQPIDVKDWKIVVSSTTLNFKKVNNSIIAPHGYFLLERSRDEAVREVAADIVYTLPGGFNNNGEKVELLNSTGEKIDVVDCSAGWFAGDTVKYRSMERLGVDKNGSDKTNWQINQSPRVSGRTFNGGQIYGSPRQSNFGFYVLNFNQEDTERTLTPAGNPYILQYYQVPVGFTLIIKPGVVIKSYYSDAKIDVYGNLKVQGSAESPVILTSGRDHSFGKSDFDTAVGSWPGADPAPKDWQGVWFHTGSVGDIAGAQIKYAGHAFRPPDGGPFTPNVEQAVRADGANLNFTLTTFQNNSGASLYLKNSSTTIVNTQFVQGDRAIEAYDSALSVNNTSITHFTNPQGAVYVRGRWPELSGLSLSENVFNPPYLDSVAVTGNGHIGAGTVVYVSGLTVPTGSSLTVEPGVAFLMAPYGTINVEGALSMLGTGDSPITISPFNHGAYWSDIIFNNAEATLHNVYFVGGNRFTRRPPEVDGMLLVKNSDVQMDNCSMLDTWESGNNIQAVSSTLNIDSSVIGNSQKLKFPTNGIRANGGSLHLKSTQFVNLQYGLSAASSPPPALDISGISPESFVNVDQPSDPGSWLGNLWNVVSPISVL